LLRGASKVDQPDLAEVRRVLAKVLGAEALSKSKRNRELLIYLVEETLAGRAERLKGYNIAIDVFNRDAGFDAQSNPLVRNQMVRLRRALEHYYLGDGAEDAVVFRFSKGEYAPEIHYSGALSGEAELASQAQLDRKPVLVVMPLR